MRHATSSRSPAFTLVELLLSITVLSLIMTLLVNTLTVTQGVYTGAQAKVEQYREARVAFETITRRLSQATLNTYWDYNDPDAPTRYVRQSELHFISGPASQLLGRAGLSRPLTHAVFFQAPLGESDDGRFMELNSSLNAWGYYLTEEDDAKLGRRPEFLVERVPSRKRCRLMEFRQTTERFAVYSPPGGVSSGFKGETTAPFASTTDWYNNPRLIRESGTGSAVFNSRPLAENIVAFVISAKSPAGQVGADHDIAPEYFYDSRRFLHDGTSALAANTRHQLPPSVEVVMVAVSEASAARYEREGGSLAELVDPEWFRRARDQAVDLAALTERLTSLNLQHQVFHTTVALRAARWSSIDE